MALTVENNAKKQLLWIGMAAIVMFFAGLTSAYIVRKPEGNWVEFSLPNYFIASTAIIVISSLLLFFVKGRLKENSSIFGLVFSVLILGVLFSFFQFKGWEQLVNQGIYLTGEGSNASGSFLYVLTLAHLVHLFGGLIALIYVTVKSRIEMYTIDNCLGLELTSIYWHFLAILWILLFFLLKFF
jgi:cytochrome c oxidase subunit 3